MKKLHSFVIGTVLVIIASTTASAFDDLTPLEAHDAVVYNGAYILDIRTAEEFIWVGHPNIENVINISFKIEKRGAFITNPSFISEVDEIFGEAKNTHIITMCRTGPRGAAAALALEGAGYTNVSNMLEGFEGPGIDGFGYRTVNGWKNSGLPGHNTKVINDDYYGD